MSKSTNPYEGLGSTELEGDTYTESFTSEHKVSVLGPTLVFKGELSAGEDLLIQGRVEGKINHNRNLTIGEQGTVKADIRARNITIEGTVQGDLYATESVVVRATGKVRGNIYAPRVGLIEGAKFKGSIDMETDVEQASVPRKSRSRDKSRDRSRDSSAKLADGKIDKLLDD